MLVLDSARRFTEAAGNISTGKMEPAHEWDQSDDYHYFLRAVAWDLAALWLTLMVYAARRSKARGER